MNHRMYIGKYIWHNLETSQLYNATAFFGYQCPTASSMLSSGRVPAAVGIMARRSCSKVNDGRAEGIHVVHKEWVGRFLIVLILQ